MDDFGFLGVWVGSTGQDLVLLLINGTFSTLLLSPLCFGMSETRTEMMQELSGGAKGVWGICLRCFWEEIEEGDPCGVQVTLMGELWIINQSISHWVDCSSQHFQAGGCKIKTWNQSYWWSQETSGAAVSYSGVESGCKLSSCALKPVQVSFYGIQNAEEKTLVFFLHQTSSM